MLTPGKGQDERAAAYFILKLRLQSQYGASEGDARLAQLEEPVEGKQIANARVRFEWNV